MKTETSSPPKRLLPAGSIVPGPFDYVLIGTAIIAIGAAIWSSRKGSDSRVALGIFLGCSAVLCGSIATLALKDGAFLATYLGPTIARAGAPRRFWASIIAGYAVAAILLAAFIALLAR